MADFPHDNPIGSQLSYILGNLAPRNSSPSSIVRLPSIQSHLAASSPAPAPICWQQPGGLLPPMNSTSAYLNLNDSNAMRLNIGAIRSEQRLTDLALAARLEQDASNEKNRMLQEYMSLTLAINEMKNARAAPPQSNSKVEREDPIEPSERTLIAMNPECKTPEQVFYALNILGSTLRSKADPYIDASAYRDPGTQRAVRGGICELFPDKLYRMLTELEAEGRSDIVSFLPHGRAFMVHKMDIFLKEVLPRYFSEQSKWSSFSRQLNLYGFLRVSSGPETGAYYHELFLKGHQNLCHYMRRVGAPKGTDRRRFKLPEGKDPNFYALPLLKGGQAKTTRK